MVVSLLNSLTADPGPGLDSEAEVCWSLEVVKYGLRLSPCDSTVTACADLYCSWISVLLPTTVTTTSTTVRLPGSVTREPDHLGRLMLRQLYGLFTNVDSRHLCSPLETTCLTVLHLLEELGRHCHHLEAETTSCLLELLLGVSDLVLSQPGPASALSQSVISVLSHSWLAASSLSEFPCPALWSSLARLARGWRHRLEVVEHWATLNSALLSLQLPRLYGPTFPPLQADSCCSTPCLSLTKDRGVQTSFRFLHILGNIVELTQEVALSRAPGLVAAGLQSDRVLTSLQLLPEIFLRAVTSISEMVDGYLGISDRDSPCYSPLRPRVSTLLHLFGGWLFQASLLGTPFSGLQEEVGSRYNAGRARAIQTLCIIFNSKRFEEEIEEAYLARFYLVIELGLKAEQEVQFSTVRYFGHLMARDLPGSNILLPQLMTFLLQFLRGPKVDVDLSRRVVDILKSVHSFPLHLREMSPVRFIKTDPTIMLADFIEDIFDSLVLYLEKEDDLPNCEGVLCILASYMETQLDSWTQWAARLVGLICGRLIASWHSDYSTCLLGLELLVLVASTQRSLPSQVTRQTLSSLCQFVVVQSSKPPPAHSKDLHSSIILAFQAVTQWLLAFPALLAQPDCLTSVLQITELAMSGSRSAETDYKEKKKPSPVSQRVSRAAEELLSSVLANVGYFPPSSLSEKVSTKLSEEQAGQILGLAWPRATSPSENFKYYFCDQNYILAVSKTGADQGDCSNTTMAIIRSPSGKTAWLFRQSQSHSHSQLSNKNPRESPERSSYNFVPSSLTLKNNLPPVEILRPCQADQTIPLLEDLGPEDEMDLLLSENQRATTERTGGARDVLRVEAREPAAQQEHQNWRMLISQLGLVEQMTAGEEADCVELDSSKPEFWSELERLDRVNTRTEQSLYVYYVRRGQHKVSQILANNLSSSLPPGYLNLLSSLGWQVELANHSGWAGNVDLKSSSSSSCSHILYWADHLSELAILVPAKPIIETFPDLPPPVRRVSVSGPELSRLSAARRSNKERNVRKKVIVVWLESFEDREKFPDRLLITSPESVSLIIFLQPLSSGLLRLEVRAGRGQQRTVAPLTSGLVISQAGAGNIIRAAAINQCRRERLEADTSQQCPTLQRRSALINIRNKYATNIHNTADKIQSLFI